LKAPSKLFERRFGSKRNSTLCHGNSWIALNHDAGRHRTRHHASGRNNGTLPDHDIGKDQRAGSNEYVPLNSHAFGFPEMGEHSGSQAQDTAIPECDVERLGSVQDNIVPNPDVLADLDSAGAMQRDSNGLGAR
jgi:hypothetical protein